MWQASDIRSLFFRSSDKLVITHFTQNVPNRRLNLKKKKLLKNKECLKDKQEINYFKYYNFIKVYFTKKKHKPK